MQQNWGRISRVEFEFLFTVQGFQPAGYAEDLRSAVRLSFINLSARPPYPRVRPVHRHRPVARASRQTRVPAYTQIIKSTPRNFTVDLPTSNRSNRTVEPSPFTTQAANNQRPTACCMLRIIMLGAFEPEDKNPRVPRTDIIDG